MKTKAIWFTWGALAMLALTSGAIGVMVRALLSVLHAVGF